MIAGMMAIDGRFPLWENCLDSLMQHAELAVVRIDDTQPASITDLLRDKLATAYPDRINVFGSDEPWNRWNWREEMLRALDGVKPNVVLAPDQDEQFDPVGLSDDLARLRDSQRMALMFDYHAPMPTSDGSPALPADSPYATYPGSPHMKAFKWIKALTYKDYNGYARVTNYSDPRYHLAAKSTIMHYCCWTKDMRKEKDWKW